MTAPRPTLRLLICGSADRGDDGAALSAIAHVLPDLEPAIRQHLEVRRCQQLDPAHLIDVPDDTSCLVLDTVVGVEPGRVVEVPLVELIDHGSIAPRSSHALPIQQVFGIAEAVRGSLPHGRFIGIGGKWFGYGTIRSRALRGGMPAYEAAVRAAITSLVGGLALFSAGSYLPH